MDVLLILVFISVGDLSSAVFKGIRMCEKECQLSKHCSAVTFDPMHLRCRLLSAVPSSSKVLVRPVKKDSKTDGLLKNCSDMLLLNRQGQTVCVPVKGTGYERKKTPPGKSYEREKSPWHKLLLHPYMSYSTQAFEINLKTGVMGRHVFPWTRVNAVAPYKSLLLLAMGIVLYSTRPDSSLTRIMVSKNIKDVHTDEEKALVFFITVSSKTEIARFNPSSTRSRKTIYVEFGKLKMSFDLNRKDQRVYVSYGKRISTLTYDGQYKDRLVPKMKPQLIACDPTSGVIYFTSHKQVLRVTKRQVSVFGNLKGKGGRNFFSMRANNGLVYLTMKTAQESDYIFRVSFRKSKIITVPSSGESEFGLALV